MATSTSTRRTTAVLLITAGLLFAAFPLLRPWADKGGTFPGLLDAMASPLWVAAHLGGAFAFVALLLAGHGIRALHPDTRGSRAARLGVAALTVGTGATLLFYGAETFALHAIATSPPLQADTLISAVREGPVQLTVFGLGLLLVAAGGVLLAVAVWRGGRLPRWSAVPLAVAVGLCLPQFFAPPEVRIAHGILTAVAAIWLASILLRRVPASPPPPPTQNFASYRDITL
ncbi:hypothetical protein [Brevibacterium yomogidense]|uniref:hypothetical protein n=1 Tax=Brevibacterium yomogidense TaxID=946573 RepID=UPI0018E06223|nr:hypothetical protein [Brevibacterium yomogidense]